MRDGWSVRDKAEVEGRCGRAWRQGERGGAGEGGVGGRGERCLENTNLKSPT